MSKKEQNRLVVLNEVEKGKMVIREAAGDAGDFRAARVETIIHDDLIYTA